MKPALLACALSLFTFGASEASARMYCDRADSESYWKTVDTITFGDCLLEGKRNGRDIDGVGESEATLLDMALMHSDNPNIVESILEWGADPNFTHEANRRIMHSIAVAGRNKDHDVARKMIRSLVEAGADMNFEYPNGQPAFVSILTGMGSYPRDEITVDYIDFLIEMGADLSNSPGLAGDPNTRAGWFLYLLSNSASPEVYEKLYKLGGGSPSFVDDYGLSYLHQIAYQSQRRKVSFDVIDWLVKNGADPSLKDKKGNFAWDYVRNDANLVAKLQEHAEIEDDDGIAGLASTSKISRVCRSAITPQMLQGLGATVSEVCGCVEDHAPIRYERISKHPYFPEAYGRLDLRAQLRKLVEDTGFICAGLWSTMP